MSELSPLRMGRITGSRAGSILGLKGAFQTPKQTLVDMVRQYHGLPDLFVGNEMTEHGKLHEPDAIAAYEAHQLVIVHSAGELVIHPFYGFLAYTPDGLVGKTGMVECKCPTCRARWTCLADKPTYYAQCQLGLSCTGRAWCDFVMWWDNKPISVERVHWDPDWLPSVLPKFEAFMAEYEAAINDPAILAREQGRGVAVEAKNRTQLLADRARWIELQEQEIAIGLELVEVKARIGEQLGDNEIATVDGKPLVKWQYREGPSVFDRASFKRAHAELEAQYSTTGKASKFPVLIHDQEGEVA